MLSLKPRSCLTLTNLNLKMTMWTLPRPVRLIMRGNLVISEALPESLLRHFRVSSTHGVNYLFEQCFVTIVKSVKGCASKWFGNTNGVQEKNLGRN